MLKYPYCTYKLFYLFLWLNYSQKWNWGILQLNCPIVQNTVKCYLMTLIHNYKSKQKAKRKMLILNNSNQVVNWMCDSKLFWLIYLNIVNIKQNVFWLVSILNRGKADQCVVTNTSRYMVNRFFLTFCLLQPQQMNRLAQPYNQQHIQRMPYPISVTYLQKNTINELKLCEFGGHRTKRWGKFGPTTQGAIRPRTPLYKLSKQCIN